MALAAGAGLVPLVLFIVAFVSVGGFAAEVYDSFASSDDYGDMMYDTTPSPSTALMSTLLVLGLTTPFLGAASLPLPARALGADWKRALISTVLYGLGFGAILFFVLWAGLVLYTVFLIRAHLLALAALVGTPALGSLVAVLGDERMVSRILPLTLVTALAMYGASLFAYWLSYETFSWTVQLNPIPLIVAALSWPVLPGVVAALRSY